MKKKSIVVADSTLVYKTETDKYLEGKNLQSHGESRAFNHHMYLQLNLTS